MYIYIYVYVVHFGGPNSKDTLYIYLPAAPPTAVAEKRGSFFDQWRGILTLEDRHSGSWGQACTGRTQWCPQAPMLQEPREQEVCAAEDVWISEICGRLYSSNLFLAFMKAVWAISESKKIDRVVHVVHRSLPCSSS